MNNKDLLDFSLKLGKLKRMDRTGWKMLNVKDCESVADHIFRTSSLALVLSDEMGLNTDKIIRMSLIHDWEESITGDIRAPEKNNNVEKYAKSSLEGFQKLVENLPEKLKNEYTSLWEEYDKQTSEEAKFVKNIDLIDMIIQCMEYEKEQPDVDLSEFWTYVEERLKDEYFIKLFNFVKEMRK